MNKHSHALRLLIRNFKSIDAEISYPSSVRLARGWGSISFTPVISHNCRHVHTTLHNSSTYTNLVCQATSTLPLSIGGEVQRQSGNRSETCQVGYSQQRNIKNVSVRTSCLSLMKPPYIDGVVNISSGHRNKGVCYSMCGRTSYCRQPTNDFAFDLQSVNY